MNDLKIRLMGVLLLAIGIVLGWHGVLRPLEKAWAGVPEVNYQPNAFLLVPASLIFGLGFALYGERLNYRNAEKQTLTALGWVMFAVVALLTAAGFWYFKQQLSAVGYQSTR